MFLFGFGLDVIMKFIDIILVHTVYIGEASFNHGPH